MLPYAGYPFNGLGIASFTHYLHSLIELSTGSVSLLGVKGSWGVCECDLGEWRSNGVR